MFLFLFIYFLLIILFYTIILFRTFLSQFSLITKNILTVCADISFSQPTALTQELIGILNHLKSSEIISNNLDRVFFRSTLFFLDFVVAKLSRFVTFLLHYFSLICIILHCVVSCSMFTYISVILIARKNIINR